MTSSMKKVCGLFFLLVISTPYWCDLTAACMTSVEERVNEQWRGKELSMMLVDSYQLSPFEFLFSNLTNATARNKFHENGCRFPNGEPLCFNGAACVYSEFHRPQFTCYCTSINNRWVGDRCDIYDHGETTPKPEKTAECCPCQNKTEEVVTVKKDKKKKNKNNKV